MVAPALLNSRRSWLPGPQHGFLERAGALADSTLSYFHKGEKGYVKKMDGPAPGTFITVVDMQARSSYVVARKHLQLPARMRHIARVRLYRRTGSRRAVSYC